MGSFNSTTRNSRQNPRPQQIVSVSNTIRNDHRLLDSFRYGENSMTARNQTPRLDIQQTCVVKNPVNLKKKTLNIENDPVDNNILYLEFSFDAATDVELRIFFECKESIYPETGIPKFESLPGHPTIIRRYQSGMNQHYRSCKQEAINLKNFQIQCVQSTEGCSIFPIVILLKSLGDPNLVQSQCTYASLTPSNRSIGSTWNIQAVKQKIQYGQKCFEVQEIFGIDRSSSKGGLSDDFFSGRECVICLTEARNTALLPCRHMCLCSGCANVMRLQSSKCPICRHSVSSLLQISVNDKNTNDPMACDDTTK